MKNKIRILIVGGGPTGVTLACLLMKYGLTCRVIETKAEQTKESKAINVSAASLSMFDRMGIAHHFLAHGKKVKHVYGHWENKRLIHINYNLIETPYSFFISMPQAKTEQIISDHLRTLGSEIERSTELVEVSTQDDHVEVVIKHQDGRLERGEYDYLIACDGAKSSVRNYLKVRFEGHDYHAHYYLLDGFVEWQGPAEDTHYYVNEKGYFIIAPMVGGYHRIVIFDESKGTRPRTKEEYQQLIDLYGPGNVTLKEVLWNSKGFFYNRLIENFRYKKRIFFAGDSAHIFSPLGGHGMNTCLQDVDNLAWKLAGVINYGWDDQLLDTYNEERKVIAARLVKATDFSTRLINKIEKEYTTNIVSWFPLLRNRENLRKRFPYQFSGLAQQYNLSEYVYSENQKDTEKENLVGRYLPFVGTLEADHEMVTTYQLCKHTPVILFFGECDMKFVSEMIPYGFQIYNIVGERSKDLEHDLFTQVIDRENKLKKKCGVQEQDILLLRPDGMVGYKGSLSSLDHLKKYLDKWYCTHSEMAIR